MVAKLRSAVRSRCCLAEPSPLTRALGDHGRGRRVKRQHGPFLLWIYASGNCIGFGFCLVSVLLRTGKLTRVSAGSLCCLLLF